MSLPAHAQVTVDRPDVQGRVEILKVHARGKTLAKDVDLEKVARRTPGFTGTLHGAHVARANNRPERAVRVALIHTMSLKAVFWHGC